jgi:hypothetical protein
MEVKPGSQTSEFKLAIAAFILGTILEGSVVPILQHLQPLFPNATWIGVALAVCGVLLQIVTFLGYNKGRAQVKVAAHLADASEDSAANPQ